MCVCVCVLIIIILDSGGLSLTVIHLEFLQFFVKLPATQCEKEHLVQQEEISTVFKLVSLFPDRDQITGKMWPLREKEKRKEEIHSQSLGTDFMLKSLQ